MKKLLIGIGILFFVSGCCVKPGCGCGECYCKVSKVNQVKGG